MPWGGGALVDETIKFKSRLIKQCDNLFLPHKSADKKTSVNNSNKSQSNNKIKFPKFKRFRAGIILIELAVAFPILLIALYYVHDLPKHAQIRRRVNFIGHQLAGMLQNVSQNRTNKRITVKDIQNSTVAAYLSHCPGISMHGIGNTSYWTLPKGYFPALYMHYVKGLPNGNASQLWTVTCFTFYPTPYSNLMRSQHGQSAVSFLSDVPPEQIYKDLRIKPGEYKIILECTFFYSDNCRFVDGRTYYDVPPRKAFGFLFLNPKREGRAGNFYFTSYVIFTPKPGLFDENLPN